MKTTASALAILISYTYIIASAAASSTPNHLRGGIDNDNGGAFAQLPCTYLTQPADYDVCMNNNVTGCQDETNRAINQCYNVPTASGSDWYVCSPASQCNTTTTTSTIVPNNTKRQVDNDECKANTGAECINRDVCWDHYHNGNHYYYCEEPREVAPTTPPPPPTCVHHNQECNPDPNDELMQCCGTLTCASVDGNVSERHRGALGGIEYACLSIRESEGGDEGAYLADE